MSVLKQYNPATSQWEAVVLGKQGPSGTVAVTAPLTNSGTSTAAQLGIDYSALQYGQNAIINGGFDVWQRGTSFSNPGNGSFVADRWTVNYDGSSATRVVSQQALTPGSIPGVITDAAYALRYSVTNAGTGNNYQSIQTKIEDVRTFAGQTVTLSFYAKASATFTMGNVSFWQNFGSGGSAMSNVTAAIGTIGTSWTRYSATVTIPSVVGKTIGTGSSLGPEFYFPAASTLTVDIWGIQLEAGSIATPFKRAGGTIQGELAACQRYYFRMTTPSAYGHLGGLSPAGSSTNIYMDMIAPVTMRVSPTSLDWGGALRVIDGTNFYTPSSITNSGGGGNIAIAQVTTSGLTQYRPYYFGDSGAGTAYIGFSSEL